MKRSLFSTIIKGSDGEQPSIKLYSMKNVGLPPNLQKGKRRSQGVFSSTLPDSKNRIEQLVEEIREREKYIKQMTDKTHSLEKKAYEDGFAQGEKAGMELGEKRFDSVIKSFTEVLEEVRRLKEEFYQKSEREMVELVFAIARRVIQKEVNDDGKIILNMIRSAITYISGQEEVRVRLNPSDLEFASQHRGEMMRGIEEMGKVILESDEGVSRGDAIIGSSQGIIDVGIERHLREVEKTLRAKALEGSKVEEEEQREQGGGNDTQT